MFQIVDYLKREAAVGDCPFLRNNFFLAALFAKIFPLSEKVKSNFSFEVMIYLVAAVAN